MLQKQTGSSLPCYSSVTAALMRYVNNTRGREGRGGRGRGERRLGGREARRGVRERGREGRREYQATVLLQQR